MVQSPVFENEPLSPTPESPATRNYAYYSPIIPAAVALATRVDESLRQRIHPLQLPEAIIRNISLSPKPLGAGASRFSISIRAESKESQITRSRCRISRRRSRTPECPVSADQDRLTDKPSAFLDTDSACRRWPLCHRLTTLVLPLSNS